MQHGLSLSWSHIRTKQYILSPLLLRSEVDDYDSDGDLNACVSLDNLANIF